MPLSLRKSHQDRRRRTALSPTSDPMSLLLTHTPDLLQEVSPSLNRVRNLRRTHVGLGTGGLDTQAIRKSFFLLDFPEVERRQGSGQLLVLGWAEVGREVTQAPGPHYLPLQTWVPKG